MHPNLQNQTTKRLLFKKVEPSYFPLWLPFFQNPITSVHWKTLPVTPEIACQQWFDKQYYRYKNNLGGMYALIENSTNTLVGMCGLLVQEVDGIVETEIGYSLLPEHWGKGYASEAAQKCRDFAFENKLSESLISIISLTNESSAKVALQNGMSIDKTVSYDENTVHIFRITKDKWLEI